MTTTDVTGDDQKSDAEPPAPRRGRGRRVLLVVSVCLLALVIAAGGTSWWIYDGLNSNLKHGSVDLDKALGDGTSRPQKDAQAGDALNLLVLGSDSRAGANSALDGGSKLGGARSDTALLVHIAKGRNKAVAVSIPRDTLVDRPQCRRADGTVVPAASRVMFNSVFSQVGSACTVKTVEQLSDVRVDHLVEVDFAGFKDLVDAIGGVSVTLDQPVDTAALKLDAGTHRLDGTQSLRLVRTRYGYGDGSDLGRITLQQKFLLALLGEIKKQDLLSNPVKLYRIADQLTASLTTDSGLASLTSLADFGKSVKNVDPQAMETIMLPVAYDKADPNRVVPAEPQDTRLWKAIRTDTDVPEAAKKSPAHGAG